MVAYITYKAVQVKGATKRGYKDLALRSLSLVLTGRQNCAAASVSVLGAACWFLSPQGLIERLGF